MPPDRWAPASERASHRIAVIDDDCGVRRALARLLRSAGHAVLTFESAEEFLASCPPGRVDCLVLDVYLGGMSGVDLHAQLEAAGTAPPTVFVTAHEDAEAAVRGARPGRAPAACLRKPMEDEALLDAIAAATRS